MTTWLRDVAELVTTWRGWCSKAAWRVGGDWILRIGWWGQNVTISATAGCSRVGYNLAGVVFVRSLSRGNFFEFERNELLLVTHFR